MTKIGRPRAVAPENSDIGEHVAQLRRDTENGLRLAAVESAVQYLSCGYGFSDYPADSSVALARARLFSTG